MGKKVVSVSVPASKFVDYYRLILITDRSSDSTHKIENTWVRSGLYSWVSPAVRYLSGSQL